MVVLVVPYTEWIYTVVYNGKSYLHGWFGGTHVAKLPYACVWKWSGYGSDLDIMAIFMHNFGSDHPGLFGEPPFWKSPTVWMVAKSMQKILHQLAFHGFSHSNPIFCQCLISIDWFKGKITGNSYISWENLWFPVDFPLSQPFDHRHHAEFPPSHPHGWRQRRHRKLGFAPRPWALKLGSFEGVKCHVVYYGYALHYIYILYMLYIICIYIYIHVTYTCYIYIYIQYTCMSKYVTL